MSDDATHRTWPRRSVVSLGAASGLAMVTGGLSACSQNDNSPDEAVEKKINNPSKNLNRKGFPIVDKPITLDFMTGKASGNASEYNKVAAWEKYQKMTNITVNWGLTPSEDLEEKRNLALSSGDYPEAFHTGDFDNLVLGKYASQGVFIKLNDLVDKYMPNLKKVMHQYPEVEKAMTFPDEGMYGLPLIWDPKFLGLRISWKLWIRNDWLDKFDMDVPKTTDEFHRYLKAVKAKQPNGKSDAIGYCDTSEAGALRYALMGSFGVGNRGVTSTYLDADPDDEDTVRFYRISDGYKALLEYVHRLYAEGLIAKNIFSIDSAKFNEAAAKGTYGSLITKAAAHAYGGAAKHFGPAPALKGPDGQHTYNYIFSPVHRVGCFVLTDKCKHPIEAARWVDYFYSDEGAKLFFMGVKGKSYKETDDGVQYLDKIKDNPSGLTESEALKPYVTFGGGGYPGIVKEDYYDGSESSDESTQAAKLLQPDEQKTIWPHFTYTQDESEKLDSLSADIEKYVDESWAKFITGDIPMSDWNKYVNKIKDMGLDDYMQIHQNAYDRYKKR